MASNVDNQTTRHPLFISNSVEWVDFRGAARWKEPRDKADYA
jgi:hypothetical protein